MQIVGNHCLVWRQSVRDCQYSFQGGHVGNFIAQINILGDILVIWAIKFVNNMQRKPKFWVFRRCFPLSLCSKVHYWAIWDMKWAIFGPHWPGHPDSFHLRSSPSRWSDLMTLALGGNFGICAASRRGSDAPSFASTSACLLPMMPQWCFTHLRWMTLFRAAWSRAASSVKHQLRLHKILSDWL